MGTDSEGWFPLPHRGPSRRTEEGTVAGARAPWFSHPVDPGAEKIGSATLDCGLYENGERRGGRIALESALHEVHQCDNGFVWIGLHDPAPEAIRTVGKHFELHPLSLEDAVHAHQQAKLELYGSSLFFVMKTARYSQSRRIVEVGEIMVFVGEHYVVTVRHGEGSPLGGVRAELEAHPNLLGIGPSSVLYAIADRVVDDYALVLDGLAADIDEIEAEVFSACNGNIAERIYRLKREVMEFRRAVVPLQAPMQRLSAHQTGLPLDPRTQDYFRDVHDHLVRDADRIGAFDELLTGVLQANLAQLSVRDNQDMRRLSAWVAIIAVPTMVFGMYGMNFDHMPELAWQYSYPTVLVVVLLICFSLHRRLKRSGWL